MLKAILYTGNENAIKDFIYDNKKEAEVSIVHWAGYAYIRIGKEANPVILYEGQILDMSHES